MRRFACVLVGGLLACLAVTAADDKGTVVEFDNLKSTTPAGWKEEPPSNRLRLTQFKVPRAKGDEADGDLAVFKGITGSAKQNLERWQKQFIPPEGKKIEDITKVEEMKIAGCAVTYVDIEGTYLDGPPMAPPAAKKRKAGYRMLAVHFDGPENIYHIKLIGPAKTVSEQKKGFDEWVKGFKK